MRAAELEVLVTVDDSDVKKAESNLKSAGKRMEAPIDVPVDANVAPAIAGLEKVEGQAKKLVSAKTVATVDANIDKAEKSLDRAKDRLDYLRSVETELDVSADIKRAEASLSRVGRSLDGLKSARAVMEVDADTSPAEAALDGVRDVAGDAGDNAGSDFSAGVIAALVSIPVAGAVIGVGVAAGKALISGFEAGLAQEQSRDRLQALTGISEADALRISRAAGEAYANNFGDSIEGNMDSVRLALQFDLIDEQATTRDAQKVVQSLAGIADVLGEDVKPIATAVTTLLANGMVKSAEEAFDVLATGAREGVDRGEDLLDTFIEYPSVLSRLGLSGEQMLGLLNQSLEGGARNADTAADALKEFQIRATDASDASAAGFEALGLSAEDMTAKIASGGEGAREGLDQVLDGLRDMEDPVARNAAAVALFGTKAEDLGEALFAMDLSNAVEQLGGVTNAAQTMFDTLADNDAAKMETAQRNIEVAVAGIQGALAVAFSDPLGEFADWVSANRGPMLEFFSDLVNGALDFGEATVESMAGAMEATGEMVGGLGVLVDFLGGFIGQFDAEAGEKLLNLSKGMGEFESSSEGAADMLRDSVIPVLDDTRDSFNEFADGQIALGYLNDASLRLVDTIAAVGSETGTMEGQVRNAIEALNDEIVAADDAGESQANLTDRYNTATGALVDQMVQMGLTEDEARALIDTVLDTPDKADTKYSSNAPGEKSKVQELADRITTLPDGSVVVNANTTPAADAISRFIVQSSGRRITVSVDAVAGASYEGSVGDFRFGASGGVVEFMAQGGLRGLTPMGQTAAVIPPNTWRVVGDRGDVPESYIPHDGSARSMAILHETMRRMGVTPMAEGGITQSGTPLAPIQVINKDNTYYSYDPATLARKQQEQLRRALDAQGM
ncbi:phage tail tape measure protein (plasmid) [Coraliomargarita sp. W4R53]